jgi:hypothetical protein
MRCFLNAINDLPSSSTRLDFLLCLLDQAVNVVIGKTGGDDACPRRAPAGEQLVRLACPFGTAF